MPDEQRDEENIVPEISELMAELPKPIQNFLLSSERPELMRSLTQKYNLHMDQAEVFEEAFLHMLLGISTPDEFVSVLSSAGLPKDLVDGLVSDVNEKVFIRLRNEELDASAPLKAPVKPGPLPPPALEYEPALKEVVLPGSAVPAPMPTQAVAAPVAVEAAPMHALHSMPNAVQPGWHPAAAVHVYVPTHPAAHQPIPAPVYVPAQEAPAPVQPVPVAAPAPLPIQEPLPQAPIPATPKHSDDPYREPVQ